MREYRYQSWGQFAAHVARHFSERQWIFRGVARSEYGLVPKIGRPNLFHLVKQISQSYSREAEIQILRRFKRAARPYLQFEPRNELEWLAVAQHHGLPTRLLDWSESPFVAAYFAVREPARSKRDYSLGELLMPAAIEYESAAIYATFAPSDTPENMLETPFEWPPEEPVWLFRPPHLSPRVASQSAVLTIHPNPTTPWEPEILARIEIPGESFEEFRLALNLAGIHEAAMFPGLDGIGRHLGSLLDLGRI